MALGKMTYIDTAGKQPFQLQLLGKLLTIDSLSFLTYQKVRNI